MILMLNERMQMRANDEQNLRRSVDMYMYTLRRAEIIRRQRFHNVLKSSCRRYHVHRRRRIIAFILSMSSLPHMATVERNIWKKPRFADIYNDIITWTEMDWLKNTRMDKATFDHLCDQLRSYISKQKTRFR